MTSFAQRTGLVAVVEDSDEDFSMLQRGLRRLPDLELVRFDRAETALEALLEDEVPLPELDVLVVDLTLSGMDGVALIEHVRSMPDGWRVPICVLSGSARPADVQRATAAGADRYVVKPSTATGLRALPQVLSDVAALRDELGTEQAPAPIGPQHLDAPVA